VFNALEFGRAKAESDLDEVLALEEWQERAKRRLRCERPSPADVVAELARHWKLGAFRVPADFPVGMADALRRGGLRLEPADGPFFPKREIKSEREAAAVAEGNRCSAVGLAAAEGMLERAVVRGRRLVLEGRVLTSERMREAIEVGCLRAGAVSLDTIVAGGGQACDPHCRGSGPLRPGELIVVDIFPRVAATGYHGDMTRTFLKGTPSDAQAKLVEAVRSAQRVAMEAIRPGADGLAIHRRVMAHFEALGYETRREAQRAVGFFHGTGHGLGLAVHEAPSIGLRGTRLRRGAVVTVEPGLYYPGLGGCRIEDVVQVAPGRPRLLSRFHYRWIVP
jgi:Xaa-Pro aminopeptidase